METQHTNILVAMSVFMQIFSYSVIKLMLSFISRFKMYFMGTSTKESLMLALSKYKQLLDKHVVLLQLSNPKYRMYPIFVLLVYFLYNILVNHFL